MTDKFIHQFNKMSAAERSAFDHELTSMVAMLMPSATSVQHAIGAALLEKDWELTKMMPDGTMLVKMGRTKYLIERDGTLTEQ